MNKVAFQEGEESLTSFETLIESLDGCVVLDLCKTVIFPERLSSGESIKLAKQRSEHQTIDREAVSFIFRLQRQFTCCVVPSLSVRHPVSTLRRCFIVKLQQ